MAKLERMCRTLGYDVETPFKQTPCAELFKSTPMFTNPLLMASHGLDRSEATTQNLAQSKDESYLSTLKAVVYHVRTRNIRVQNTWWFGLLDKCRMKENVIYNLYDF